MRTAVIFERCGPYHHARLEAAGRSVELTAVEIAGRTETYAWDPVSGGGFRRVTLFPDDAVEKISPPRVARAMSSTLDSAAPDVVAVNGWSTPPALAALAWSVRRSVPAVVMSESNAWDRPRGPVREYVKSSIAGLFAAGLVGGRSHRDYLVSLGVPADRVFLGYDAVDNAYFAAGAEAARRDAAAARRRLGLPVDYFLASCRFVPKKNVGRLLDAFAAYRRAAGAGAWSLVLVGDGPLRVELERRSRQLGLEGCVVFAGFRQYHELPAFYGLASAFVHPSTVEQWGLVINEAMASGLPVAVSERCGAAAELVADGETGLLFDPDRTETISETLSRLAGDGELRRRVAEGAARRIALFGPDRFADGLRSACEAAVTAPVRRKSVAGRIALRTALLRP